MCMKSKMPIFKRISALVLSVFFVAIAFLTNGCMPMLLGGNWIEDLNEQLKNGDITQEEYDRLFQEHSGGVDLEGVKVLRRPLNYDYDGSTRDEEGKVVADYYEVYAKDIFKKLYNIYGIVGSDKLSAKENQYGSNIFEALSNVMPDNNNLNALANMYIKKDNDPLKDPLKYFYDGIRYQIVKEEKNETEGYVEVTADTSKGWKWGFPAYAENGDYVSDKEGNEIPSFIHYDVYSYNSSKGKISDNKISNQFSNNDYTLNIISNFYSEDIVADYLSMATNYNEYIYTLAHAIYRIVLGLTPKEAKWVGDEWVVDGYTTIPDDTNTKDVNEYKSSAQLAYEDAKAIFQKAGSYVGLTKTNKEDITKYILKEVIGESAQSYGKQDLFYRDVVEAVVEYCGKLTTIGKAEGDDIITNVGDTFIASEIIDYPSTSFFISQSETDPFESINSHEYQSIILMPKKELKLTDIWLDFKYIARKGETIIDDPNLFIRIHTTIRWFDGRNLNSCEKSIDVYNGKIDPGGENTTLDFELDSNSVFGTPVVVGKFECDPINADINPDRKVDEYTGFNYILLNGKTTARHYYQVINSASYGGYGVLNQEKIAEEKPGMSYLEISFDVEKKLGDFSTNYDFQVGFSQLFYDDRDFSWVQ